MLHIHRHPIMGQKGHSLSSAKQLWLAAEQVSDLIGTVTAHQSAEFTLGGTVLNTRNQFTECVDDRRVEISHGTLVRVGGIVQIHGLTIQVHIQGDGGFDKPGVTLANDIGKQDHQGRQGYRNGGHAISAETLFLAIPAFQGLADNLRLGALISHTVPYICAQSSEQSHSESGSPRTASCPEQRLPESWHCRIPDRRSAR